VRLLAAALTPRTLAAVSPDTALALSLLVLGEGVSRSDVGSSRLALPAMRESVDRARVDAPRLVSRLARARGRGAAYTSLVGVPEVTVAWTRALTGRPAIRRHLDSYLGRWRRVGTLATGDDVLALGVIAGPAVGQFLRRLRAAQASGLVRSRAGALRWLADAVARGRKGRRPPLTQPGREGG
jgi:hypothetical protein